LKTVSEFDRKAHWEKVYQTKQPDEVSWYQDEPKTSLELIEHLHFKKSASIMDNGGGDSHLVDYLLKLGYENITVQDISEIALERVKQRLGKDADKVRWIVADEAHCDPDQQYDLWHDRAAFHFLTDKGEIENYKRTIRNCIRPGGYLIIATFSEQGPKKCSGLEVRQYSENSLTQLLIDSFEKDKCFIIDHVTPSNAIQNFVFCVFRRTERENVRM
jgi:SAM-dependent methyltransferase